MLELCKIIVHDLYGQVAADIVNLLGLVGRLTARDISNRLKLHPTVVYRCLVSLVQVRAALFWTDSASYKTFYSVNLLHIYDFLRQGWFQATCLSAFGSDAGPKILSSLAVLGHLSVSDLQQFSGCSEDDIKAMIKTGTIKHISDYDFWPMLDLCTHIKRAQYNKLVSDPAGLALSDAQKKVQVQAATDTELAKITAPSGNHDSLTPDTLLTVNPERFLAVGRREALVAFAALRIGKTTALVYEKALALSERKFKSMHQRRVPCPEHNVSTLAIARELENIDLTEGFVRNNKTEEESTEQPNKRQKLANNGINNIHTFSKNELVTKHLQLLEESPVRFIRRAGDSQWFVPFDQVIEDLRRTTFDGMVKDIFGPTCARLLRVIRDQSKVDEKYLGQLALVQQRDIRHELTKLQLFGFIDLQEVPRGNDRAPGRNMYFWYHKRDKAYHRVLDELYASICKVYTELDELRKSQTTLMGKLNRQDVQTDPEKYLTAAEKSELKKFREKERDLVSKIALIDSQVRIFRDY